MENASGKSDPGVEDMRKRLYEFVGISFPIIIIASVLVAGSVNRLYGDDTGKKTDVTQKKAAASQLETSETKVIIIAIAIMISAATMGAGYAVAHVGSAALGAASEKPELFGRSILFVGLAEGIAIWGFVVSILLYTKI